VKASFRSGWTTGEVVGQASKPVPTPRKFRGGPLSWGKAWEHCANALKQNLDSEIAGCVYCEHVDPRPEWVITTTEGLASTGKVIVNNTVKSLGFNMSVTAGGAVGTVGVICGLGTVVSYAPLVVGVAATWAVSALKSDKPYSVDVVLSVVNGDLELKDLETTSETVGMEGSKDQVTVDTSVIPVDSMTVKSNGTSELMENVGSEPTIVDESRRESRELLVVKRKKFFRRPSKAHGRIPVLAGELASLLKLRHVGLEDNASNRFLIRTDAGRRAEALRREGEYPFKNMRNMELTNVAMHASEMYWIFSQDEEYVSDLYSEPLLKRLRKRRDQWMSSFRSST